MGNYEPGQDRNVAALSNLLMCDGFNLYEFERKIHEDGSKRSHQSRKQR